MICILPVGEVEEPLLQAVEQCVRQVFGRETRRMEEVVDPEAAFDAVRRQYSSIAIMQEVLRLCPSGAEKLLAVTECDLFIPMLSFVLGQAQLRGRIALLSLARLHQAFYGLPPDAGLTMRRALKETLHELGHTYGLTHCMDPRCPMALATTIRHLDGKSGEYCASCRIMIREALALTRTEER